MVVVDTLHDVPSPKKHMVLKQGEIMAFTLLQAIAWFPIGLGQPPWHLGFLGQSFEGMRPFAHVTSSPRDESLLLVFVVSTDRVKLRAFLRLVTIDQLMDVPITATSWKGSKVDQNLVKFGHIWKLYDMG
ncbi:hypothetical protein HAX54_030265, partial [Datura stramonium]|nr:hypothetical protein [Datura stramonium]